MHGGRCRASREVKPIGAPRVHLRASAAMLAWCHAAHSRPCYRDGSANSIGAGQAPSRPVLHPGAQRPKRSGCQAVVAAAHGLCRGDQRAHAKQGQTSCGPDLTVGHGERPDAGQQPEMLMRPEQGQRTHASRARESLQGGAGALTRGGPRRRRDRAPGPHGRVDRRRRAAARVPGAGGAGGPWRGAGRGGRGGRRIPARAHRAEVPGR